MIAVGSNYGEDDALIRIKQVVAMEGFTLVQQRFEQHMEKILTKLLSEKTSPEETLALKSVYNLAASVSPMALCDQLIVIIEGNLSKNAPKGLIKTKGITNGS
tara:strand:- start:313 stop:621 length:309 start_codon:yes stop_codon:yes gene_type:complete